MAKKRNNPFRGFVDSISEANRMREHWMTSYDPAARESAPTRTPGCRSLTSTLIQAGDLIIRCELAGVPRDSLDITYL